MSTPNTLVKPAAIRRTRFALQTVALVFAVTACCAFAGILADRFPKRFDATATREHQLSPRTQTLLGSLKDDYELVVAANFSTLDQQAARRTQDVLDNFSRTSPHVQTTIIDVSSARGLIDLDAVMTRLIERFRPQLDKQRDGLDRAAQSTATHVAALGALSGHLLAIRDSVKETDPSGPGLLRLFTDFAAKCRTSAEDLSKAQTAAKEAVAAAQAATRTPATDEAVAALRRPVSESLELTGKIGETLDAITRNTDDKLLSTEIRSQSRAPREEANALRTQIGQSLAAIDDLPRTPVGAVLRLLERTSAAIVIGPPSDNARKAVTSVELSAIFPARGPGEQDGTHIDLRARTEELLSGAIASLARDDAPIVVLVHDFGKALGASQLPQARNLQPLALRGVDFAEWPAGIDSAPPTPQSLAQLDPAHKRPIVYIVLSAGGGTAEAVARYAKLIHATKQLIAEGRRVLVCTSPSTTQSLGQADPMAEALEPLGIKLDSGRPLLHQQTGPRGRVVSSDTIVTDPRTTHPIAQSLRGLATYIPWAIPIAVAGNGGPGVQPIMVVDSSSRDVWAESEWIGFSQVPYDQQSMLVDPPAPDPTHDDIFGCWPASAPTGWPIAMAIERAGKADGAATRAIVIGSNKWMSSEIIGAESDVNGRRVPAYPGNAELLDACVHWLAGQDSLISTSATAQEIPRIPALADSTLTALRWGLIGGLPLLVLLLGAIWRLIRG
jgi:hypothetical protein